MGLVSAIAAGSRLLGETLAEWRTQINSLTAPGWTDYSASFSIIGSVSNPTKGNSTYSAYYRRPSGADVCDVFFRVTIGSTFSAGSGNYSWALPFAPATPNFGQGTGLILDLGAANRQVNAVPSDTSGYVYLYRDDASSPVGSSGPGTAWATGDIITIQYRYPV